MTETGETAWGEGCGKERKKVWTGSTRKLLDKVIRDVICVARKLVKHGSELIFKIKRTYHIGQAIFRCIVTQRLPYLR